KIFARLSRLGVKSDQSSVERAEQNSSRAPVTALPIADAAVLVVAPLLSSRLRIVRPDFRAGLRVQRNHAVRWRGKIQDAINHDWRRFKGRNAVPVRSIPAAVNFAGVVCPYAMQTAHVVAVDLGE